MQVLKRGFMQVVKWPLERSKPGQVVVLYVPSLELHGGKDILWLCV